jgi:uncharacterized membrane protein
MALDMSVIHIILWVLWNISLAWFPVALAFYLARRLRNDLAGGRVRWMLWLPLLLLWLLFLPNTAYLLTEWRHYLALVNANPNYVNVYRYGQYPPAATLKLLMITAFFWTYSTLGLVAFFLAVYPLNCLAAEHWNNARLRWLQGLIFLLCSVGTYLGLVSRFNSWDIFRMMPFVLQKIVDIGLHPILLVILLVFAAILWLLYVLFDIWMEGALTRAQKNPASIHCALLKKSQTFGMMDSSAV